MNTIVVDAQFTNELKYQHIHLARPFKGQNDEIQGVSGADVRVETASSIMNFHESPDNPGHCFSQFAASTSIDKDYKLIILDDDREYLSETYMIHVLPSPGLQWIYHNDNDLYSIQFPAGPYNPEQQAKYEAPISWDHLVDSSFTDSITTARVLYVSPLPTPSCRLI